MMPYIDRDLMQWPIAWPGSGQADVVIQPNVSAVPDYLKLLKLP